MNISQYSNWLFWAQLTTCFEWYQRDKGKDNSIYTSGPDWYAGYIKLIPSLEDKKFLYWIRDRMNHLHMLKLSKLSTQHIFNTKCLWLCSLWWRHCTEPYNISFSFCVYYRIWKRLYFFKIKNILLFVMK